MTAPPSILAVCSSKQAFGALERAVVNTSEWLLTAAVIAVPLAIAVVVTLWSLKQVRYRPKKWTPPTISADEVEPRRADTGNAPSRQ